MSAGVLMHYGKSKKDGAIIGSGRYPLGSGEDPYQHQDGFNDAVRRLKRSGMTEREIAEHYGIVNKFGKPDVAMLRAKVSIAKNEQMAANQAYAVRLKEHGYSNTEIGRKMGINESSVRNYIKAYEEHKTDILTNVSNTLKDNVDKDGRYIDISPGTELDMGVTRTKLSTAVAMLQEQGYEKIVVQVPQMGLHPNQKTYITVLAPPGTKYADVVNNMTNIKTMDDRFVEKGEKTEKLHYPDEISSDRIKIRYAEEGGSEKDGVIELRRGVKDLDLGEKQYAQVRINVDGTHYLKGMAMYSAEDMPKGVDIIFNTNKKVGTPGINPDPDGKEVFKKMSDKDAPINPFGSTIVSQKGALNICKEEGDWDKQKDRLASQFLSKQSPQLAKKQLDLAAANKRDEYEEIMSMTNPAIKKKLLKEFADSCDAAAVELHAAALPRQSWKVILPISDMKDNEVYAPAYKQGEKVVLVRYPHGGIFEIPELTVNNKQTTANKVMHNAMDAIGINSKVAERLSGADFDGDTVLVIPTKNVKIRTHSALAQLKDFDPKAAYPGYEGMKTMSSRTKQLEMGKVSNLITDMTIGGAPYDEIARAVKHSMVVIDAEKHKLNYKQSEKDNGIQQLKDKWQPNGEGKKGGGASTLISMAKSVEYVPARKMNYDIDEKTGEKIWKSVNEKDASYKQVKKHKDPDTGKTVYEFTTDPETGKKVPVYTGKVIERKTTSTKMAEAKDARALSSGTVIENIYADYANEMKALGNKARKSYKETSNLEYNPSAAKTYAKEVESLNSKLVVAQKNAPRERQAQIIANANYEAQLKAHPEWKDSNDKKKKIRGQAIQDARAEVGAKKERIKINDKEWEAIQAGAITNNKLMQILDNTDSNAFKERAMPRETKTIRESQVSRMKAMSASGYSLRDIADAIGVSPSTVSKYI